MLKPYILDQGHNLKCRAGITRSSVHPSFYPNISCGTTVGDVTIAIVLLFHLNDQSRKAVNLNIRNEFGTLALLLYSYGQGKESWKEISEDGTIGGN